MKSISIIKPGIIFGNIVTLLGGFFLGSGPDFHFTLLLCAALGMALVIASGCILNNIVDRDIDSLMERTCNRVLVKGLMSRKKAVMYAILCGFTGSIILYFLTNPLTMWVALIGLFVYVGAYSLWMKRKSLYGTTIGGIAGAIPPVVGYCAASHHFDLGAVVLFFILFFWQLPHFYAIAIYRLQDFRAASLPVLPAMKGVQYTKKRIRNNIILFTIVALLPTFMGYEGIAYFVVALAVSLGWLYLAQKGFKALDDRIWARKNFLYSILVITVLCLAMGLRLFI